MLSSLEAQFAVLSTNGIQIISGTIFDSYSTVQMYWPKLPVTSTGLMPLPPDFERGLDCYCTSCFGQTKHKRLAHLVEKDVTQRRKKEP
jgi:hypothetical protein